MYSVNRKNVLEFCVNTFSVKKNKVNYKITYNDNLIFSAI